MTLLNSKASFKLLKFGETKLESKLCEFTYGGINSQGQMVSGTLSAMSRSEVRFILERDGVSDISVANKKHWYDIEFGRPVSLEVLLQVTRQLASFSEAGIPVAKGIGILADTTDDKRMAEILDEILVDITTRMLLAITHLVQHWWWIFALLAIVGTIVLVVMRRKPQGRLTLDRIILKMPIAGSLAQLVALERFCRVLSTLVRTQVHLPEALELAGASTGNRVYEDAIMEARKRVLQGEGLAGPLERAKIFPTAAIQIFRIGEESGQLGSQLNQAASFYSDELDHRLKNFTALLEPATLIVIGGGVGFVAVALVSAMYGIYSGVRG